jgi:hypothetical protein
LTGCRARCRIFARSRRRAHYHLEDVHRAGGVMAILGELDRASLLDTSVPTVHSATRSPRPRHLGCDAHKDAACMSSSAPVPPAFPPDRVLAKLPVLRRWTPTASRLHPQPRHRLQQGRRPGRALRKSRRARLHRQDRRRRQEHPHFSGPAVVLESQDAASRPFSPGG